MKSVYLAGPMRGYDKFNFPAFLDAAKRLRPHLTVLSPAEHDLEAGFDVTKPLDEQPLTLADSILWDLEAVAKTDAVVVLPGWENSQGVALELHLARFLGKPVFTYKPHGPRSYWLEELVEEPAA